MADKRQAEAQRFYAIPGPVTKIGKHEVFAEWLADDPAVVFRVVQGLVIHDGWLSHYGIDFNDAQRYDFASLDMEALLDKAVELGGKALAIPRAPEERVIGCCREFATLMTALLRAKGIPARSRCGFAGYFDDSPKWEDHWVCEYWDDSASRWVFADPQMDPFQQSFLGLTFSPLDVPRSEFLTGGQAWLACRSGEFDPGSFGIGDNPANYGLESLYGLWFVRGNLLRDFAALNKVETVPLLMRLWRDLSWESWRLVGTSGASLSERDLSLLDRVARMASAGDKEFSALRGLYETEAELRPPEEILLYR